MKLVDVLLFCLDGYRLIFRSIRLIVVKRNLIFDVLASCKIIKIMILFFKVYE